MAKKPIHRTETPKAAPLVDAQAAMPTSIWEKLCSGWVPHILFLLAGLLLYANTFQHEFALDDELIVCGNDYVQQGTAGIKNIFTGDIFDSYNKQIHSEANLAGGRYRPFSLATFALEQEIIGTHEKYDEKGWDLNGNQVGEPNEDKNHDGVYNGKDVKVVGMPLRHVVNVLLYILSISVVFVFLRTWFFKNTPIVALLISLLFLAHPIHTEVVANVKSRDEILSLMFMILTLHYAFTYFEQRSMKNLVLALAFYMIALLSKEYGVSLLLILPLALYTMHPGMKWKDITLLMTGMLFTFLIYYAIRSQVVLGLDETSRQDSELLNNPFKDATAIQAWATKIFINLKYFGLLLFPYKLSCDYSFNVIPFRTFSAPEVWLSIALLGALFAATWYCFRKKHWLLFPLLFILIHLFLINNFFFNIGATMGERLVYHSSLGVCILLVVGIQALVQKIKVPQAQSMVLICLPLLVLAGWKTVARNPAWKNNISLYTTDVIAYPNSTMLNGNACISLFDMSNMPIYKSREKQLLDSASMYGYRALALHPGYFYTHMNLGLVKAKQGKMDSAAFFWLKAKELSPYEKQLPELLDNAAAYYYNKGMGYFNQNNLEAAMKEFQTAHQVKPNDHRPLYFIGMIYLKQGNKLLAKDSFMKGLQFAPGDQTLQQALTEASR